jgi:hypothetical protein
MYPKPQADAMIAQAKLQKSPRFIGKPFAEND